MSEYTLKINNIFQSNIEDEDEDIKKQVKHQEGLI